MKRTLNYRFAKPDPRDISFRHMMATHGSTIHPTEIDLTQMPHYPPVIDQGDIGSCTAASACAVKDFITRKYRANYPTTSILGFYACERIQNNELRRDAGSDGRTSGLVMLNVGVGDEEVWPYRKANLFKKPTVRYFKQAAENKIGAYYFLHGHAHMRECLAQGYPFVFGTTCTKKMCDDNFDGWLKDYTVDDVLVENGEVAGHQMVCVGYKTIDGKDFYLIRNSFGTDWGLKSHPGHMWLTADMMIDRAWVDDCITYRLAREPSI